MVAASNLQVAGRDEPALTRALLPRRLECGCWGARVAVVEATVLALSTAKGSSHTGSARGSFWAVTTGEGEHLSLRSLASLLNPELGQGPGVNAGLRESRGMIKVSEGQGWRVEPRGRRKDRYDCVNPYSLPPAAPSSAACSPCPAASCHPSSVRCSPSLSPGTGTRPASPRRSLSPVAVSLDGAGSPATGSGEGLSGDGGVLGGHPALLLLAKPQPPAWALSRGGGHTHLAGSCSHVGAAFRHR